MSKGQSTLKFNKNLVPSVQDAISSADLVTRLAQLHEELSMLEQGQVKLKSLEKCRADLINKKLVRSKDTGVQAFTACCLSDVLRLYAPDAPYNEDELAEIFGLFIGQFRLLADPENGYYVQQTYLVTRLLEFRSIVLITDLSGSAKLIEEMFEVFYDKERNTFEPKLTKIIGSLLGETISECDTVSMSVLRKIFNKFLTHDFGPLRSLQASARDPAFDFSLTICQSYSNRLGRQFTKFYSEILYGITNPGSAGSGETAGLQSTLDSEFKTLLKLHKLTANIWEHVPELLGSVVGFVHQELCSDNVPLRIGATRLVGDLLAAPSAANFVTMHTDTYNAWMSKIADIDATVRREWVKAIPKILDNRSDLATDICKGLNKTLMDTDDVVRLCSLEALKELTVPTIWENLRDPTLYTELLQLTREKNKDIRETCINVVTNLYSESLQTIPRTQVNTEVWEVVDKVPCVLFNLYYINDTNINFQVDNVIFERLFPLQPDDSVRVQRLLHLLKSFDQKAFSSFYAFNKRQLQMSTVLTKFIEFCDIINSGEAENEIRLKLNKTIEWLVFSLPTQIDCKAILEKFTELNDRRIQHLIKVSIARDVKYSTMKNSITELFSRLKDEELFRKKGVKIGSSFTRDAFQAVIKVLIYRSAPLIYNTSTIPLLLGTAGDSKELEIKKQLVEHISIVNPSVFKDQMESLKEIVKRLDDPSSSPEEAMTTYEALKTMYKISKSLPDSFDASDEFFLTRLKDFAVDGSATEAKYAVKLIALTPGKTEILKSIKTQILPLDISRSKNFESHVCVLAQIFKIEPRILEDDSTEIVGYLIRNVLLANQRVGDLKKDNTIWVSDMQLEHEEYLPLAAKLYSLKLFTNKLRSIADDVNHDEIAQALTEKTMKLFFYLLASGGELVSEDNEENYPTPNAYQTKLRCSAGLQVLKTARIPNFNRFILPPDVMKLVNLVEDECLEVRKTFLDRLRTYIGNEHISIKFLPLVFFMAYEPDSELKQSIKTWINFTFNKPAFQKGTFFERALPRLVHCIAHHPDVTDGLNDKDETYLNSVATAIDYLIFYFDAVATQQNICLLYYLAGRIKQYKDNIEDESAAESPQGRNNASHIYVIAELAQLIMSELKNQRGWNLPVYPGKLNLPSDLYQPFPNMEEAQRNAFMSYISDQHVETLTVNIRAKVSRLSNRANSHRQGQRKRIQEAQRPSSASSKTKKKRKVVDEGSENEDTPSSAGDYRPKSRSLNAGPVRKSSRQRKNINYHEENDDESENEG
ncbi:FAGL076Wp [Eremothecium gossypii FDAG1]|nr:FAGL076Wp [Eremothecium gossypii FDAG1]